MADLNTFDGVVALYNSITPLRGKRKECDIRPLGKRAKWWERIVKVDDNTYILSDGWWTSTWAGVSTEQYKQGMKNMMEVGPIVWQRRADGDYFKVVSCPKGTAAWSRYQFIGYMIPWGMKHRWNQNGVHWIEMPNRKRHLLPKYTYETRDVGVGDVNMRQVVTDGSYLEFKVTMVDGKPHYECVSDEFMREVPVVNRYQTKIYNPLIRELWDYTITMLPVFGDTLNEQRVNHAEALGVSWWGWFHAIDERLVQRILLNENDEYAEQRLSLAVLAGLAVGDEPYSGRFVCGVNTYTRFRKLIQKAGGMMTTKELPLGE